MTKHYKKIAGSFIVIAFVLSVLAPVFVFGQGPETTSTVPTRVIKKDKDTGFCERLDYFGLKVDQRLGDNRTRLGERISEQKERLEEKRDNRQDKVAEHRERWDQNRENHFTKLEEIAITDEQKQALLKFKEDVQSAISARRTAFDEAKEAFRSGVEDAVIARKSAIEAATSALAEATKAVAEKAKAACEAGRDAISIRQILRANLKAAQDQFQADRKAIDKTGETVKALNAVRKEAIKKDIGDFKTALEAAKTEFKAAFEKSGDDSMGAGGDSDDDENTATDSADTD